MMDVISSESPANKKTDIIVSKISGFFFKKVQDVSRLHIKILPLLIPLMAITEGATDTSALHLVK